MNQAYAVTATVPAIKRNRKTHGRNGLFSLGPGGCETNAMKTSARRKKCPSTARIGGIPSCEGHNMIIQKKLQIKSEKKPRTEPGGKPNGCRASLTESTTVRFSEDD